MLVIWLLYNAKCTNYFKNRAKKSGTTKVVPQIPVLNS